MTNEKAGSGHLLTSCPLVCYASCLLIWFLPGSYSYYYLESQGNALWITSLFDAFPASVLLPLILAGMSLWCLARKNISKGCLWAVLLTSLALCLYLGFLEAICLPHFRGETFIWLQALPFPLTLTGAACLLLGFRSQRK